MQARVYRATHSELEKVLTLLQQEGVEATGADFSLINEPQLTIDTARALSSQAAGKPFIAARRVFVVCTNAINNEAQNALLKTLEEPPHDALFVFLMPLPHTLLPTVRSRVSIVEVSVAKRSTALAQEFLKKSPEKRIEMLKDFLENERDMQKIDELLSELEHALASERGVGLRAVYRARKFASDKGALLKPLLEQVALLSPLL